MVDKTLTQLNQASQVDDTDIMYAVKDGTADVSVSVGQLKAHITDQTVASFNNRTGVVSPEVGDYTADQILETASRKFVTNQEKTNWNSKQDGLVSGLNIKTFNGQSVLGNGDLTIGIPPVDSVNTKTGRVVLDYNDVGAEQAGVAAALLATHQLAVDPHPQYMTQAEGDSNYVSLTMVGVASGVATLDTTGKLTATQVPDIAASRKLTVADDAARLALPAYNQITIAYQVDTGDTWALNANDDPAVAANWSLLGGAAASGVGSFNGRTGTVVSGTGDYTADQITETTRKFVSDTEKAFWDLKQPALVSGTNIKTINGAPILGAGDVASVESFKGRSGSVTPAAGDYTTDQITETTRKFVSDIEKSIWNAKQDALISGSNIKTINGDSILGNGDLTVNAPVMSVNGQLGNVSLTHVDVGADAAGTSASAMTSHTTAVDPHPQYMTQAESDAAYVNLNSVGAVNGVASLDSAGKVIVSQLPGFASARKEIVTDNAARLALTGYSDITIAYQVDNGFVYALAANDDPSDNNNWQLLGSDVLINTVVSFNGRKGDVTAATGDYDADQITETARKFVTDAEKTFWNAKQDGLVSGTNIKTVNGQSILGSGDIVAGDVKSVNGKIGVVVLDAADVGAATANHTHISNQVTDFVPQVRATIGNSLVAGTGITLGYDPVSGLTNIASVGETGGQGGYVVQTRNGVTAGQVHSFGLTGAHQYNLGAYALREETALTNQTVTQETFDASSSAKYNQTSDLIWSGVVRPYVGETTPMTTDGQWFSSQIRTVGAETVRIATASSVSRIPVMSSNSQNGYVISASSQAGNYDPWLAFDNGTGGTPSGTLVNGWAPETVNTGWLQVKLPSPETFTSYNFTNADLNETQSPISWTMQGSNDGVSWTIIHSVTGEVRNVRRLTREYPISSPGSYLYYRLDITQCTSAQPFLEELRFFAATPSLLENSGIWYTASAGTLTQVPAPSTTSDFEVNGFTEFLGNLNNYPVDSFKLVTPTSGTNAVVTYTPHAQIAIQSTPTSLRSYGQVNSATITATQTGNGKVRVAVSRNGTDWFAWDGAAWVVISSNLSNDTTSASTVIAAGMTPAAHNAITTAQWNTFFGGPPDQIQYAYALDVDDPVSDVASIDTFAMNVNFIAAWLKQTEAQVEIRWYPDSVTFRTVNAGNYKLAYQTP